ncbi:response regulator [Candidatus Nitrosopumilus sp. SW]|uniref:response regulator n=1 Tax=Candidatus Nitrosopumilus sp. SW TaxID=2508726 RepID=UPI001152278A|nr:response regulator [Candidatus Nitrosopumilus sp. SW]QDI88753.1 response regulator [Candidatus Nitrosopumilus sp. SW]
MKKTILVVEDDDDLLMIYKEILELNKFDVHTAVNGQEGVEKFKEVQPSLVIMDGDMPVLDGYEAFNQIKKLDNNANVVIVTGMAEYEKKNQEAIKRGLIKVITKPLGIDQLVDLARKYSEIKLEK